MIKTARDIARQLAVHIHDRSARYRKLSEPDELKRHEGSERSAAASKSPGTSYNSIHALSQASETPRSVLDGGPLQHFRTPMT